MSDPKPAAILRNRRYFCPGCSGWMLKLDWLGNIIDVRKGVAVVDDGFLGWDYGDGKPSMIPPYEEPGPPRLYERRARRRGDIASVSTADQLQPAEITCRCGLRWSLDADRQIHPADGAP